MVLSKKKKAGCAHQAIAGVWWVSSGGLRKLPGALVLWEAEAGSAESEDGERLLEI